MNRIFRKPLVMLGLFLILGMALAPGRAAAHCDAYDGPVIVAARSALEQAEVTPLLKWVKADAEGDLRAAFAQTLKVRGLGSEARELADRYFFETLVRLHRAGEGASYTGLKPAGQIAPVVAKADQALAQGNIDALVKAILQHTEEGIRERFAHALETAKHPDESVAAGREYVEAYVTYVHYIEGIAQVVHGEPHHAAPAAPAAGHGH
ncbi:MAG: DUF6448 family protein [Trichloromonas sp.]|nr:DUF6448 family protein [Trichloromonas sp.]